MTTKLESLQQQWKATISSHLVGRTIVKVAYLPADQQLRLGWTKASCVLFLDNGTCLIPMADDEGNDGGALLTNLPDLPTIPTL